MAPDISRAGVDLLWPPPTRLLTRRPARSRAVMVLPSARSPRMLVPTGQPGAAAMFERHSRSRRQRLGQSALAWAQSRRVLPLLPVWRLVEHQAGAQAIATIDGYVRSRLPHASAVGVLLGPPRANAKPVLRIFDAAGETIAFGKVGHNPLSAALVRHERDVLQELAGAQLRHLQLPRVLDAGCWQELEVLIVSALPAPAGRRPSWQLPLAACYELAELAEVATCHVGQSAYLSGLSSQAAALGPALSVADQVDSVARQVRSVELSFGRWHGDLAPWNMGAGTDPVRLWDWERSRIGVPLGFDIVHFAVQRAFMARMPASAALASVRETAREALRRWYGDVAQVEATVLLYLCEILVRYAADCGPAPTAALRSRISTISTMVTLLTDEHPGGSHADA